MSRGRLFHKWGAANLLPLTLWVITKRQFPLKPIMVWAIFWVTGLRGKIMLMGGLCGILFFPSKSLPWFVAALYWWKGRRTWLSPNGPHSNNLVTIKHNYSRFFIWQVSVSQRVSCLFECAARSWKLPATAPALYGQRNLSILYPLFTSLEVCQM